MDDLPSRRQRRGTVWLRRNPFSHRPLSGSTSDRQEGLCEEAIVNAEISAEWLRRQRYRVVRTASSYWYEASPRVYQAFPYHWAIEPPEEELRNLLVRNGAVALRYSAPLTYGRGKLSYHVVCTNAAFGLSSLPRQAQQSVRKGLEYACVEPIPLPRLASEGWALRQDSLERQGRVSAETEPWWRRLCLSAEGLPGFEAWGAIHDGQLVASFLAFTCDDCFTLLYEQSASAHLEYRVNNAIYFRVTQQALQRPGLSGVFLGLHSLDAPASIDQFKFRMGYTAKPVRQRVVFHPLLAPLLNRASHAAIKRVLRHYPHHPTLAKAEGMVRFYLEGKRPPHAQDVPECLLSLKGELSEVLQGGPSV